MALDDNGEQELRTQLHEAEKELAKLQAGLPKEKLKNVVNPDLARTVAELKEEIATLKDEIRGRNVTILGGSDNPQTLDAAPVAPDAPEGSEPPADADPRQFSIWDY